MKKVKIAPQFSQEFTPPFLCRLYSQSNIHPLSLGQTITVSVMKKALAWQKHNPHIFKLSAKRSAVLVSPTFIGDEKTHQNNGTKTPAPHPRESRQKLLTQFFTNQRRPFCPAIITKQSSHIPPGVLPVGTGKYGLILTPIFSCITPKRFSGKAGQKPRHPAPCKLLH
jgi:hypothetical protein